MKRYQDMTAKELADAKAVLMERYQKFMDMKLSLNIARGNPSVQQLDMIMPMMDVINSDTDCRDKYGTDARNYGALLGLQEAREFFGKERMEEIVKVINQKEEGGDGLADEYVLKFAEVQNG